ncbi:hypothetical protein PTMSG1_02550 [Pyrenophora teres f. maculata]|nr:hypothetical protein PTMSG1_02550 [Pyrenophora teres f. maculata]
MPQQQPFHAAIYVPADIRGYIVTDRVACRRHTRVLAEAPKDVRVTARREKYQRNMMNVLLAACADVGAFSQKHAVELVQKFVAIAQMLERSKAVGFLLGAVEPANEAVENDLVADAYPSPVEHPGERTCCTPNSAHEYLLHPLLVALLAFQLGGPVNAAFTTHELEWKLPDDTTSDMPTFYSEGDTGDLFHEFRITRVWETYEGRTVGPSGNHSVFMTGEATPQPLLDLSAHGEGTSSSPVTILYDPRHAALYYDCQDSAAVRRGVSLDFHLNTLTDDILRLLSPPSSETSSGKLTLSKLVTEFPILNYTSHFHDLLFNSDSLVAMLTKLSTITIPPRSNLSGDSQRLREERFEAYKNDNWAHLPQEVKLMESDICLEGTYPTPMNFLNSVTLKARRDVHLPIGMDLFPHTLIAENMEWARKFIRDMSKDTISKRLSCYAHSLVETAYCTKDLISTPNMREVARLFEVSCLELTAFGFVGESLQLLSMAALVHALGVAIDGLKEVQLSTEPWIEETDLQIYRTRCLYFFWCVDLFVCFLEKPVMGPFTTIGVETAKSKIEDIKKEVYPLAKRLLRNWVAWSLFVDSLPEGGFCVRQPSVGGRAR